MKLTLKPQQRADVDRWLAEPTHAILDASKAGTGKSVKSVTLALELWCDTVLVIGIKSSFPHWRDTFSGQSDGFVSLRHIDASKSGQVAMNDYLSGMKGFYFIGSEYLAAKDHRLESHNPPRFKNGKEVMKRVRLKTWEKVTPDLIIADEVHRQAARFANGNNTLKGLKADWKLALSATPAADRFENFYGVASWLWPERSAPSDIADSSFARWKVRFCETRDQYIPGGKKVVRVTGEKNPGEFVTLLPCYTRDEGDEEEPPPAERVIVELTAEQRRVYDELENQLLAWIERNQFSIDFPVTLSSHLATVTMAEPSLDSDGGIYFRDNAGSSKLDKAIELMRGDLAGRPILHLTHSKKYAKLAVARMESEGFRVAEYTGDTKMKDRHAIKDAFIAGDIDHIVATAQTIGTSTDGLQRRSNTLIWHSKVPGRPSVLEQSIKRIWRQGGDLDGFRQIEILARNTKDEGTFSNLNLQHAAQKIQLAIAS